MLYPSRFLFTILINPVLLCFYPQIILKSRFFRLFPPLAITLIISYSLYFAGIIGGEVSLSGLLSQTFYLANYHSIFHWGGGIPDGLEILWSLAVEEHFYLFFPLLFYFLIAKRTKKSVAVILGGITIAVLFWRLYLVLVLHAETYRTYYATETRIDSILFGCIMALAFNPIDSSKLTRLNRNALLLLSSSIVILLFTLVFRSDVFRETFRYTLQGIALMPIFYYSIRCSGHSLFKWLNWGWLRKLGVYSYFIYLIHLVVIRAIEHQQIASSKASIFAIATIVSISFAYCVDKYIDIYFIQIRKKFRS